MPRESRKEPVTRDRHPAIDLQGVAVAIAFLVGIGLFAGEPRTKTNRVEPVRQEPVRYEIVTAESRSTPGRTPAAPRSLPALRTDPPSSSSSAPAK